ncbi:hypothetical protein GQ53DRAFT_748960 [Thozetella sp. PMI_491]|nr:hypothetical protein GQ53DRAFT_748960 [Thozetella sp. PMI_491]
MASPPAAPKPLAPNMVYRPLTPSSQHYDDHEEPIKFRLHIIAYLRCLTAAFALTGAIGYAAGGLGRGAAIAQFVFLWVILFWNVLLILWRRGKSKKHGPSFHCEIGFFWCTCGPDDDDRRAAYADDDDGAKPPPKDSVRILWIFDVALGLGLVIAAIVAVSTWGYWDKRYRPVGLAFGFITGAFQMIIGFAAHFKAFRPALIHLYSDEYPDRTSRIRLPQDAAARQSRSTAPVSIAA